MFFLQKRLRVKPAMTKVGQMDAEIMDLCFATQKQQSFRMTSQDGRGIAKRLRVKPAMTKGQCPQ
jgi:hypothetical protein